MCFSQVKCTDKAEIVKLCDKYFEGEVPEFYFDRWVFDQEMSSEHLNSQ